MRTLPLKFSDGPCRDGCEPLRVILIGCEFVADAKPTPALAPFWSVWADADARKERVVPVAMSCFRFMRSLFPSTSPPFAGGSSFPSLKGAEEGVGVFEAKQEGCFIQLYNPSKDELLEFQLDGSAVGKSDPKKARMDVIEKAVEIMMPR